MLHIYEKKKKNIFRAFIFKIFAKFKFINNSNNNKTICITDILSSEVTKMHRKYFYLWNFMNLLINKHN